MISCPGCGCFKQTNCESNIPGLSCSDTFRCTTCDEVYQIRNGETIVLREGEKHG